MGERRCHTLDKAGQILAVNSRKGGGRAVPTDWAAKVRNAITNLEINIGRVLEPDRSLALIDDVVAGKFDNADKIPAISAWRA